MERNLENLTRENLEKVAREALTEDDDASFDEVMEFVKEKLFEAAENGYRMAYFVRNGHSKDKLEADLKEDARKPNMNLSECMMVKLPETNSLIEKEVMEELDRRNVFVLGKMNNYFSVIVYRTV